MQPQLQNYFASTESQKANLLASLEPVPLERLRFRASPESWSVLEIVDHLAKVDSALVAYAEGRRKQKETRIVGAKESIGAFVVRCVMRSPLKIKTPASAAAVLPADPAHLALHQIAQNWTATRLRLAGLLEHVTAVSYKRSLFRHPISGQMTAEQGVRFIHSHFAHHLPQIKRALHSSERPQFPVCSLP